MVEQLSFQIREGGSIPTSPLQMRVRLIIGQQTPTSTKTAPRLGQIQDILVAADNPLSIPVFMKNNLESLVVGQWSDWKLRQEFPKCQQ